VVEAYNRDLSQRLASGKLLAIDNQVDPTNGTVKLKAEFDNPDGLLFPNQFVNARMQVDELEKVAVLPSAAVQRGPNGSFVYIVTPEETVEPRPVIVAESEGAETAIESGVSAGETVVTSGLDRLFPGAKVSTKAGAAAKETSLNGATVHGG
jgi:multidrug efflux system membrane fusion protein